MLLNLAKCLVDPKQLDFIKFVAKFVFSCLMKILFPSSRNLLLIFDSMHDPYKIRVAFGLWQLVMIVTSWRLCKPLDSLWGRRQWHLNKSLLSHGVLYLELLYHLWYQEKFNPLSLLYNWPLVCGNQLHCEDLKRKSFCFNEI